MVSLYVPLDVNYYEDDKIIDVGPMAELLFVRALAFAKRAGSDGRIRANQLQTIAARISGARRLAERLVDAGLWETNGSGWYIVSWFKRNPTAVDEHEAKSTAGALGNHRRWHIGKDGTPKRGCHFCEAEGLIE